MYEDIEKVKVNGVTMYKWGNQLFLSRDEAEKAVRKGELNTEALEYGYLIDDYDPIALVMAGKLLRGMKL